MDAQTRSKYAEYIAAAVRYASNETGLKWPDNTIVVTKSYHELAEIDEIVGFKVYVMDMPSPYDFWLAFPSEHQKEYPLQKAFREYVELYEIDW